MKDLLEKLKKALGDGDSAKLAAELEAAASKLAEDIDSSKAEAAKLAKDLKAAQGKVAQLEKDLAAKSGNEAEELTKLKAERDKLAADLQATGAEVGKLKLDYALRDAARTAGLRDADALKMLDTSGLTLDESGKLVGADKALKAFKEAKPYLFEADKPPAPGTGGAPRPGDTKGASAGKEDPVAAQVAELAKLAGIGSGASAHGWGSEPAKA